MCLFKCFCVCEIFLFLSDFVLVNFLFNFLKYLSYCLYENVGRICVGFSLR